MNATEERHRLRLREEGRAGVNATEERNCGGSSRLHSADHPERSGRTRTTSVPAPGALVTVSVAPIDAARSRMPIRPQCPVGGGCEGSNPRPSSRTPTRSSLGPESQMTHTVRQPEWFRAFAIASPAMLTISASSVAG